MDDMKISDMMRMQKDLYALHRDAWSPMTPEHGREFLLWMVEEMGEVISIIKKKGDRAIREDPAVRAAFLEEMSDVLMYYTETLLRYGVTPAEISESYRCKHRKNMGRDFSAEYHTLYQEKQTHEI